MKNKIEVIVEKGKGIEVWEAPDGWYEVQSCNRTSGAIYHQTGDIILLSRGMIANITQSVCETRWWRVFSANESSEHPGDGKGCLTIVPINRLTKLKITF